MLHASSNGGSKPVHWTQTPEGRARMSKIGKKRFKKGFVLNKSKMARNASKHLHAGMETQVIAKRLRKLLERNKELLFTGDSELDDMIITAHTLTRLILK